MTHRFTREVLLRPSCAPQLFASRQVQLIFPSSIKRRSVPSNTHDAPRRESSGNVICGGRNRHNDQSQPRGGTHDEGRPWLDALPPLITILPESPRAPYPITWEEQDRIFPKLPARIARMALFAVNTGLRESNVCGLEWAWEVDVPEVGRSVFVIPREAFKSCARGSSERRRLAHRSGAARSRPDLGLPSSRPALEHDEQHRVAACATTRSSSGAHS